MDTASMNEPNQKYSNEIVKYYKSSAINGLGRIYLIIVFNNLNDKIVSENYLIIRSFIKEIPSDAVYLGSIFQNFHLNHSSLEEMIENYKNEIFIQIESIIMTEFKCNKNDFGCISAIFQDYNPSFFFYEIFDKSPTFFFDEVKMNTKSINLKDEIAHYKSIREMGQYILSKKNGVEIE